MDGMGGQSVWGNRPVLTAAAAVLPLVGCAGLAAFRGSVTNATAVLVLVLIVVAAAATGDRLAGVVAALSSGVWFDFFLTEPYGRFTITDPNDIEATVLLVLVGIAVTEIALWGRRQQARASRRAGYLDAVLRNSEVVAQQSSSKDLISHVARQISEVQDIDGTRFVEGDLPNTKVTILEHDGSVIRQGFRVKVDRDGLPTDEEITIVIRRGGVTHGRFLLTAASRIARPSVEQRQVAVLLADQVGATLATHAD